MKKRIFQILAISVTFTMASCQKDKMEPLLPSEELGFSVRVENGDTGLTKSATIFSDDSDAPVLLNLSVSPMENVSMDTKGTPIEDIAGFTSTFDSFTVWGWSENGSTRRQLTQLFKNTVVKHGGHSYSPTDASGNPVNLFPLSTNVTNGQYAKYFYALAYNTPAASITSISSAWNKLTFKYTTPAPNTTEQKDAEVQQEIFVGTLNGTLSNSEIPMSFKHALARIRFVVGNVGRNITIDKISMSQIYQVGTCSVANDGTVSWGSLGTRKTFVQTFDYALDSETEPGTDINDSNLSKSFLLIPQKIYSTATVTIDYSDDYGSYSYDFKFPSNHEWLPGNTYTYTINTFESGVPWIDFPHWTKSGGNNITVGGWIANEYIEFCYPQVEGQYEKFHIPIHGLTEGVWYELSFAEALSKQSGKAYFNYDSNPTGSYACRVDESIITSTSRENQLGWYDGTNDSNTSTRYIWMLDGVTGKNDYTPTYDLENDVVITPLKILFKATAETMYWNWDFSLTADGTDIHDEIHAISIEPVALATTPSVDFINSSHYGFWHQGQDNTTGYSSFKTYATYSYMEFHGRSRNNAYERINVPLINLEIGHRYRINFTFERARGGNGTSGDAYFGYRVASAPNNTKDKYIPAEEDDFQNKTDECTDASFSITEFYEFEATAETMYWIWEMSKLKNLNLFFFRDVTIEDVTRSTE